MNREILVVEDEPKLANLLRDYLQQSGFAVTILADGLAVVPAVRMRSPALILLDLMLPGRDGMEICRELRTFSAVPIIMTTARVEEIDRLLGLELGADDYICKPFSPREVVARVRAVLRRSAGAPLPPGEGVFLDAATYCAGWEGRTVALTAVEFNLLRYLAATPGRIYSRQQLIDRIYPDQRTVSERTIDSHIKKLRRKLLSITGGAELIRSVYGVGYAYDADHPS
ncbi:MAG: two-component system response regulator BaeR [Desulfuromonadales bacterium GWD2_61_12]|nr:MAG: two-component system response regulator BaeR [Desulfuromonadales bacterium GWD2_61_12]HBT84065.1 two-component system response regulator BaeR [Desulfuromonas sp.]